MTMPSSSLYMEIVDVLFILGSARHPKITVCLDKKKELGPDPRTHRMSTELDIASIEQ
jgi:hypothetical protein